MLFIHSLLLLLLCIHCCSDSQKRLQQARTDVSMKTITFQVYEKMIRTELILDNISNSKCKLGDVYLVSSIDIDLLLEDLLKLLQTSLFEKKIHKK